MKKISKILNFSISLSLILTCLLSCGDVTHGEFISTDLTGSYNDKYYLREYGESRSYLDEGYLDSDCKVLTNKTKDAVAEFDINSFNKLRITIYAEENENSITEGKSKYNLGTGILSVWGYSSKADYAVDKITQIGTAEIKKINGDYKLSYSTDTDTSYREYIFKGTLTGSESGYYLKLSNKNKDTYLTKGYLDNKCKILDVNNNDAIASFKIDSNELKITLLGNIPIAEDKIPVYKRNVTEGTTSSEYSYIGDAKIIRENNGEYRLEYTEAR